VIFCFRLFRTDKSTPTSRTVSSACQPASSNLRNELAVQHETEVLFLRSNGTLWLPKTPSELKMQRFRVFVRSWCDHDELSFRRSFRSGSVQFSNPCRPAGGDRRASSPTHGSPKERPASFAPPALRQTPLGATQSSPPPFTTSPPSPYTAVVDPRHVLPRTYEWNASAEQGIGKADVITLTYVGAGGRKLMRQDVYNAPNPAQFSGEFDYMHNGATSSYNTLQAQFRHRLAHGLQTLLSYTWAHSIDDVSSDVYFLNVPPGDTSPGRERGPSDYDIRHTFSGAVSYNIPAPGSGPVKQIFGGWSIDSIIYARSAPPVNVVTGLDPFNTGFLGGAFGVARPNLAPGVPLYVHESNAPGGKIINAAAFSIPAAGQGNLGRNALRGFGATQLLGFQTPVVLTTRHGQPDLIPFAHNGYRRIFTLYADGKFRSRREMANVVLPRTWRDKRLFVSARVESTVNAICVINLSYVAPMTMSPSTIGGFRTATSVICVRHSS